MRVSECERFRRRLDRDESGVFDDRHGLICEACAVERRAALVLRELLANPEGASAPGSFASRVAYLAGAEATQRRARSGRTSLFSPEVAWTIAAAAVGACALIAIPAFIQSVGSAVRGFELPAPARLLAFAAVWVAFAEVLVLNFAGRMRQSR